MKNIPPHLAWVLGCAIGVLFLAAIGNGAVEDEPPHYTICNLVYNSKAQGTMYFNSGDTAWQVELGKIGEGLDPLNEVNELCKKGYVVDQWIFGAPQQSGLTGAMVTYCILRKAP